MPTGSLNGKKMPETFMETREIWATYSIFISNCDVYEAARKLSGGFYAISSDIAVSRVNYPNILPNNGATIYPRCYVTSGCGITLSSMQFKMYAKTASTPLPGCSKAYYIYTSYK